MKLYLAILSLAVIFSACQHNPSTSQNQEASSTVYINDVNAKRFKRAIEEGDGIILDVRTPEEVASKGYIQNASLLDFYDEDFNDKINLLTKNKEIYVYCATGGRSIEVVQLLKSNGFDKIYHLERGLMDWENEGFDLVRDAIAKDDKIEEWNLEEFEAMLVADKPILIDFHTVWCAPCRKMAPLIDQVEEDLKGIAIVKRIDLDRSKEVGKAYNLQGVPVFVIFKDGKEVWRHNGIISQEELKAQISKI
ncbi:thioredoxin domain-containing protein [Litoribacter populi]|uniref:thioredoxin domain-containing protein n=1 Tax=Litoribacter populi TaxID=2598460 RepID=UPI00117FACCA|nr:thioredoxin domain-containing protein [Litoribacter populi]